MTIEFNIINETLTYNEKTVSINRKSAICLKYLYDREGYPVSKDELLSECWGKFGIIVTEVNVRQLMFKLRKSINSLGMDKDIIITVGKTGYQLETGKIKLSELNEISLERKIKKTNFFSLKIRSNKRKYHRLASIIILILSILSGGFLRYFQGVHELRSVKYDFNSKFNFYLIEPYHYPDIENVNSLLIQIQKFLDQNQSLILKGNNIYLSPPIDNTLSFFLCDGEIFSAKSYCSSVSIIGEGN